MRLSRYLLGIAAVAMVALVGWPKSGGQEALPEPDPGLLCEEPQGLAYSLECSKAVAGVGEPVELRLTVRNAGGQAVVLEFLAGQECDFTITRGDLVVWQWWRPRTDGTTGRRLVLEPGETLIYTAVWTGRDDRGRPLEPGQYEAWAVFLGEPAAVRFVGPAGIQLR